MMNAMRNVRLLGLTALILVPLPLFGAHAPTLSRSDEAALLTAACSWADDARADIAKRRCTAPSDLTWSSARPGRFVERDGEWLVSLAGPCIGGCPGITFVARKIERRWTEVARYERVVTDSCVTVRGLLDARDRIACLDGAGPHFGFMMAWLEVRDLAAGAESRQLLYQEHGGECFLAEPPARAEYVGDLLSELTAGEAGSDTALTVRLTVRRAACDRDVETPEALATTRGTHVLRFIRAGNDVVPDAPSAVLIEELGWAPETPPAH